MNSARRLLLGILLASVAALATATPALAHTELKSSDPADGASLSTAPTQVSLTFEEAVSLRADPIKVVGPDGSAWKVGTVRLSGATVSAPVTATGPAGTYTLNYSVIADDGDDVTGKVVFSLTVPAAPTTTAAASTTAAPTTAAATSAAAASAVPADEPAGGGVPAWVWILVVAVVVVVVGGALVLRSRRSSGS